MIDLMKIDSLNQCLEKGYDKKRSAPISVGSKTRASILADALEKARPSAQVRMRTMILKFQEGEIELMECPVCLEPVGEVNIAMTPCGHPFCSECILNVLDGASSTREAKGKCPTCRDSMIRSELTFLGDADDAGKLQEGRNQESPKQLDSIVSSEVNGFQITSKEIRSEAADSGTRRQKWNLPLNEVEKRERRAALPTLTNGFLEGYDEASSTLGTKISRLLQEVTVMIRNDSKSKCVVFSQFLGALDVASEELAARGIRFVRVDGNMKQYQRADALSDFSRDPTIKVFLLSMRAGAVGLTLTAADHCFVLDTPQNSAIEEQAIDRIHRIGQTRPVIVKRFVIEGTVEQRILSARRHLGVDLVGTCLDGSGIMADEEKLMATRPAKRTRFDDEEGLAGRCFQRLQMLEILFGCSAVKNFVKA